MIPKKTNRYILISLGLTFVLGIFYNVGFQIYIYKTYHSFIYSNWQNLGFFFTNDLTLIIGVSGNIIYIKSKFKKHLLLRLYMMTIVLNSPISVVWMIYRLNNIISLLNHTNTMFGNALAGNPSNLIWQFLFQLFGALVGCNLIFICFYGLFKFSKTKVPKLTETIYENGNTYEMNLLSAKQRFVNLLIDLLFLIYSAIILVEAKKGMLIFFNSKFWLTLIQTNINLQITVVFFYYYFLLEGVFGFTFAKCITSCKVVNDLGEKPGVFQILGRTLCRFIPFEAFSFLPNATKGWHDAISNTYVVEVIEAEEQEFD